jgi:hypothetical protein
MRLSREAQKIVRNLLIFALFLSVAILFYHFYEGWAVSKCLVFAIETMTTIGYFLPVYSFLAVVLHFV